MPASRDCQNPRRQRLLLIFLATVAALLIAPATQSSAGTLSVGTKVIYPGGPDQPPLEKDTGVVFSAGATGGGSEEDDAPRNSAAPGDSLNSLESEGSYDEILDLTGNRNDPEARAYRAIALFNSGNSDEAIETGRQLLLENRLTPELRQKIIDELGLEEPSEELSDGSETEE